MGDWPVMDESDAAGRIEALELAVTQLADAVEVVVLHLHAAMPRLALEPVLEQVASARRLIGTEDPPEPGSGFVAGELPASY